MKNTTLLFAICMLLNTSSFSQAGTLDSSFGKNGKIIARISKDCYATAVAIQPDGKIVVAGSSDADFLVLRYKKEGTIDKTFGNQGIVVTDFGGTDIAGPVLPPDGKIIVAGLKIPNCKDVLLIMF